VKHASHGHVNTKDEKEGRKDGSTITSEALLCSQYTPRHPQHTYSKFSSRAYFKEQNMMRVQPHINDNLITIPEGCIVG
jgi:hypothetical protein